MNRFSALLIALLVLAASATAYDRRIRITNGASEPLTALQMAAEGGALRADALGGAALQPGKGVLVGLPDESGACLYSLKITFASGRVRTDEGINVCELSVYTVTD
jgi:hypothetical protein